MKDITTKRPIGLVPGSPQWLSEIQGPKLLIRLIKEIDAQKVGEMNPTGAKLLGMALDRIMPTLQNIHHSGETQLTQMSDEQLKEKLKEIIGEEAAEVFEAGEISDVQFKDITPEEE